MTETSETTTTPLGPGDEMRAMLTAGADHLGYLNIRAAVHLLTFTDLPAWRGFARLADIERVECRDGVRRTVALVYDWPKLPLDTRAAQISGSGCRLLLLAVALAAGQPVDLRDSLSSLGHAHARRVMEAVAIATGADEFYTLTPTPALDERLARQREMSGDPSPTPAAAYDWARYERTCDPDRQLDGLGDLALFLGGSEDSFTGRLLALVAKAQSTPEGFTALERAFPREVFAWRVWMGSPSPLTAAGLCAALTGLTGRPR